MDTVSVSMRIGGILYVEHLEEFAKAIIADGLFLLHNCRIIRDLNEDSLRPVSDSVESISLGGEAINYGNADRVTNFCEEHGLSYVLCWDTGESFDGGSQHWFPPMSEHVTVTRDTDGVAVIHDFILRKARDENKLREVVNDFLVAAKKSEKPLRPFRIKG